VEHGIIQRSGTWHSYGEVRLGQGRERSIQFLTENPELLQQIDVELRNKLGMT
jgi:recombination protein RecA